MGGYGEGFQLDSTSNLVVLTGNQISTSTQGNLLLTGASNAVIGGTGVGDGNTLSNAQANVVVTGQGTACEASGNCGFGQAGYTSMGNDFVDNTVTGGEAGVVVEGPTRRTSTG